MSIKKGHHFSDDLKADPLSKPTIGGSDPAPMNAPKTPKEPAVHYDDPPASTKAGAPDEPENPEEEGAESPSDERKEKDSGMY
jgi:hypothetical protein